MSFIRKMLGVKKKPKKIPYSTERMGSEDALVNLDRVRPCLYQPLPCKLVLLKTIRKYL